MYILLSDLDGQEFVGVMRWLPGYEADDTDELDAYLAAMFALLGEGRSRQVMVGGRGR